MSEVDEGVVQLEATSLPYVGQWNRLLSTTNWEKGRIILRWREAMIAAGAADGQYTDLAWAARRNDPAGAELLETPLEDLKTYIQDRLRLRASKDGGP